MKNSLLVMLIVLISYVPAWSGYFDDTKKLAEQGNPKAQFSLGVIYVIGEYALQDYKQAVYWLTKSAEQGNSDAQNFLGLMFREGQGGVQQDHKQALYWYTKSAEQGDPEGQFFLGAMYLLGQGVQQDYKQALYWYTKSAEQGKSGAQHDLGMMYYDGKGVPQDYKQAAYWVTKSAMQGDSDSQIFLAAMYYEGKGVPQNYKLSYVWVNLASAQGDKTAIEKRVLVAKRLSTQQITEAQELATEIQYQIDHPPDSQDSQTPITKTDKAISGSGTGFIITRDGYILTCHHVIKNANEVQIKVGRNTFPAEIIRDDPYNDLALLKINGSHSAIAFSSKLSAEMGQEVFTIGYPNPIIQGMSAKFTEGTISSLTGFQDDLRLYQISVPVQPGNSGGPLLDANGNVLGVIVAMLDAKTTFRVSGALPQNVNYAVKIIYAKAMLNTLPEISKKLIAPSNNKSDVVDRVKKSTVMVLSYGF